MPLLTAADVKRAITGSSTTTTTADEDQTFAEIGAAVDTIIERYAGAGVMLTAVKTWRGLAPAGPIMLPWVYASVTSVTVDEAAVAASTYDAQTRAAEGILDGVDGAAPWARGQRVTVVATVGAATAPADIERAAYALARHWGQLDRQGGRGAWADESGAPIDASIPAGVMALLAGNALPGFA